MLRKKTNIKYLYDMFCWRLVSSPFDIHLIAVWVLPEPSSGHWPWPVKLCVPPPPLSPITRHQPPHLRMLGRGGGRQCSHQSQVTNPRPALVTTIQSEERWGPGQWALVRTCSRWPARCPSYHLTHALLSCTPDLRGCGCVLTTWPPGADVKCWPGDTSPSAQHQTWLRKTWPGTSGGGGWSSCPPPCGSLSLWYNQDACVKLHVSGLPN